MRIITNNHKVLFIFLMIILVLDTMAQGSCAPGQYQKFAGRTTCFACPSPYQACSYTTTESIVTSTQVFSTSSSLDSILFQLWGGGGGTSIYAAYTGIQGNGGAGGYSLCYINGIQEKSFSLNIGIGGNKGPGNSRKISYSGQRTYVNTVEEGIYSIAGGGGGGGAVEGRYFNPNFYSELPECYLCDGTINGGNGGGAATTCNPRSCSVSGRVCDTLNVDNLLKGSAGVIDMSCSNPISERSPGSSETGGHGCNGGSTASFQHTRLGCSGGGSGWYQSSLCNGGGLSMNSPQDTRDPPRSQDKPNSTINTNIVSAGRGGLGLSQGGILTSDGLGSSESEGGNDGLIIVQSSCNITGASTVYDSTNHALICVCNAGYFQNTVNLKCIACSNISYQPNQGRSSCFLCPQNTVSPPYSTSIDNCTAAGGYYGTPGFAANVCQAGYYCPAGSTEPIACTVNTYCQTGSSSPNLCPRKTESQAMSTSASACVVKYGFYGPLGSELLCTNKPALFSIYTGDHDSSNECPWACIIGYFTSGNTCVQCSNKPFKYSNYTGNHPSSNSCPWACFPVPSNAVQDPTTCTFSCNTGFYMNDDMCKMCTNKPSIYAFYTGNHSSINACPWACIPLPSNAVQDYRTCIFTCNTGHYRYQNQCPACTNKPAAHSHYTGNHESANACPWSCVYEPNSVQNPNTCTYVCKAGYYRSSSQCLLCHNLSIPSAYYTIDYNSTGTCTWACITGYYLSGSACQQCTNKPPSNSIYTGNHSSLNACPWACNIGFYKSGSSCVACTNKVTVHSYYTSNHESSNNCEWNCNAGYYYVGVNDYYDCIACTGYPINATFTGPGKMFNICPWVCNTGFYKKTGYLTCLKCTVKPATNSYFTGNHESLNACPWSCGSISNGRPDPTTCIFSCDPNYYLQSSTCVRCPNGKYSSVYSATSIDTCKSCDIGTFDNSSTTESSSPSSVSNCIDCEIGKYNPLAGATSCLICPPNTGTKYKKSSSCDPLCGYFFNSSSNLVEACPEDHICD